MIARLLPLLFLLLLALFAAGFVLVAVVCGRREIPDYWDETMLLTRGKGARRDDVLQGKAWLEQQRLEPVETESDDELKLCGVFLRQKKPKGTVLMFHGCRSSWKLDCSGYARFFYEKGFQLLMADERAHGASGGRRCAYGVWERYDVRGWTNYLAMRFGDEHKIIVYGFGMGGAAALMASSLELYGDVRGIVAEGAYTTPRDVLQTYLERQLHFPCAPLLWLLNLFTELLEGFGLSDQSAADAVRESGYPVLLLHGTEDAEVPIELARRIARAGWSNVTFLPVEGGGHGTCRSAAPAQVEAALEEFMNH